MHGRLAGFVTNAASALITGLDGVETGFADTGVATLVNNGTIEGTGTSGMGVFLRSGGSSWTTGASALITGVTLGAAISSIGAGTDSLANHGTITATGTSGIGVHLADGGIVTNAASAMISGVYPAA